MTWSSRAYWACWMDTLRCTAEPRPSPLLPPLNGACCHKLQAVCHGGLWRQMGFVVWPVSREYRLFRSSIGGRLSWCLNLFNWLNLEIDGSPPSTYCGLWSSKSASVFLALKAALLNIALVVEQTLLLLLLLIIRLFNSSLIFINSLDPTVIPTGQCV